MPNLNNVQLMGNCTRDPEFRTLQSGTAVCDLSLAISRKWTENGQKKEEVTYVDVTLWARLAEIARDYLHKGEPVFIQGRLHQETWDDKQTGQKRSRLKVVAENLQLLTGRPSNGTKPAASAPASRTAAPKPAPAKAAPNRPSPAQVTLPDDLEYDENGDPKDLPF